MKHLFLIGAFCGAGALKTLPTHAQTAAVMAQQLAELQTLQHSVKQGYQLVTNGLQTIGQVTNGEFQLHKTFFGSLGVVSPAVNSDLHLEELERLQSELLQQLNTALDYWKQQRLFQP